MRLFQRRSKLSKEEQQRQEVGSNGWTCHVCGDYRPDSKISVYSSSRLMPGGVPMQQNVRYCNDRPECIEGAKTVQFIKG